MKEEKIKTIERMVKEKGVVYLNEVKHRVWGLSAPDWSGGLWPIPAIAIVDKKTLSCALAYAKEFKEAGGWAGPPAVVDGHFWLSTTEKYLGAILAGVKPEFVSLEDVQEGEIDVYDEIVLDEDVYEDFYRPQHLCNR